MRLKHLIIGASALMLVASCTTSKTQLPYFTDIREVKEGSMPLSDFSFKIKPDDELIITVTSASPTATAQYNLPMSNPSTRDVMLTSVTPRVQTYIVNGKGDIQFPVLGDIHVEGMTTLQLQEYLTKEIGKDVEDPLVRVQMVNAQVYIDGEVLTPKNIELKGERITVLDAIAAAGGMTPYGERSNVLVIREEDGQRKFARLDLNSSEVLSSPYFYLQQQDYVYVEPNKIRQANSRYNQDNAYKLSLTSTIVSASSVVVSLIIALVINKR